MAAGGLLVAALGLTHDAAVAQEAHGAEPAPSAAPGAATENRGVTPPKLVEALEPEFPEQARAAGLTQGQVVLRLTIDAEGKVTAAELTAPAGSGFDEAATRAALSYRFEPARRGEVAVAARILVSVAFELPASTEPAAAAPATAPSPSTAESAPSTPSADTPQGSPPAKPAAAPIEFTVRGQSEAERMRRSSEAVHVVETDTAKRQTADLGEVLARTQGVGVQRSGGLGSDTRFSLNGLTDDQIRFFLDGVPLEFSGYAFGIASVPVNLVERVEIYRGVVPIRFGADALGGAVNLVSDHAIRGTHGSASLQAGSFGTYRSTLSARHLDEPSGWLTRVNAFVDRADNDYPMAVVVPDAQGREVPARVSRFHDAYAAAGANVETGFVNKPWARRLLLRAFVTHYDKEIQHNLMMTFNPYGNVTLAESAVGGTLRYENTFARRVVLKAAAGYAHSAQVYRDLGECVFDWFGRCLSERLQPGERRGRAEDQRYQEHAAFGRLDVAWHVLPGHELTLSTAPILITRTGDERRQANPAARDALSAERGLFTLVSGVEYELELFGDRLENVAFGKDYLQILRAEDPLSTGVFRPRDRESHRLGFGDSLRYTGGPIDSLGFKAGGYSDVQVDGRNFLMVPNENYSETTAYEVVNGEAKPGFKIQGSVDHIVKLR